MPFFEYHQNNSGGGFDIDADKGIGPVVIIEADSAHAADSRAIDLGIYFDGCESGLDCSCCGDRWSAAWGDGDPIPSQYGLPLTDADVTRYGKWAPEGTPEAFVHYADGRIEGFGAFKKGLRK